MCSRAYFIIDVIDIADEQHFVKILRELEDTQGIELVDPVKGGHDIVALVETSISIETLAARVWAKAWVKNLKVLPIASVLEKRGKLNRSWL